MEHIPDRDLAVTPATSTRTTGARQRVLAGLVVVAAALLVYSLSGGPWARATVEDGTGARVAEVELPLSGEADVAVTGTDADAEDLAGRLDQATGGATRDLTQVLAVLIVVVAAVGLALDLRSQLWSLLAAASMVCLLAAAIMRDEVMSTLATGLGTIDAGPVSVDPSGWSGLAIGSAAVAALGSFLATAQRGVSGRGPTPVFGPDDAVAGDPTTVDPTPPGAPGPAASPDPVAARRRRTTPAGRVRARFTNSLPSRER